MNGADFYLQFFKVSCTPQFLSGSSLDLLRVIPERLYDDSGSTGISAELFGNNI